jgi:predicted N-acetyltransferase YhbS
MGPNTAPDTTLDTASFTVSDPAPGRDGVVLRPMTDADLPAAHALTADLRWPHRLADWEQAFRHAEGLVAERDGEVVGTALRWRWGPQHATVGLVVVAPACQGRRIGHRLMVAVLDGLDDATVLLHATSEGRGLYERLGFLRIGELRQHQGTAQPSPPIGLEAGWRLRPASQSDLPALQRLDAQARGMPRNALIEALLAEADTTVVLDHDDRAEGFAILRRFGRGHVIGPVVAPDAEGAKALIAHLSGLNAGRFTRIDIDFDSGLAEWLESIGLLRVDAPTTMLRGEPLPDVPGAGLIAIATQALG